MLSSKTRPQLTHEISALWLSIRLSVELQSGHGSTSLSEKISECAKLALLMVLVVIISSPFKDSGIEFQIKSFQQFITN